MSPNPKTNQKPTTVPPHISVNNGRITTSQQPSTAFQAGKKTSSFFPATTEQNIAHFNLFLKPSVSFYLMAIVAIVAIHRECIIPVALFNWSIVTY
jgi:hypothetical protein